MAMAAQRMAHVKWPGNRKGGAGMERPLVAFGIAIAMLAFGATNGLGEGPYVDGKRHGDWVIRFADGFVGEGPYADGKRHGDWIIRRADGFVGEGPKRPSTTPWASITHPEGPAGPSSEPTQSTPM